MTKTKKWLVSILAVLTFTFGIMGFAVGGPIQMPFAETQPVEKPDFSKWTNDGFTENEDGTLNGTGTLDYNSTVDFNSISCFLLS